MRILLDESLPRRLKRELRNHKVATVPEMGWAGKSNGELLRLASSKFDIFLTADRNLPFQLNLRNLRIGIVILAGRANRFEDIHPLLPKLKIALRRLKGGKVIVITSR